MKIAFKFVYVTLSLLVWGVSSAVLAMPLMFLWNVGVASLFGLPSLAWQQAASLLGLAGMVFILARLVREEWSK